MQLTSLVKVERSSRSLNDSEWPKQGIFRCGDGRYINVTALQRRQFVRLCQLLGLDHLANDPRVFDSARRHEFQVETYPALTAAFGTKPSHEWLELLDESDVPAAPILEREQVFSEPQMVENGMFAQVEHPHAGPVQSIAPPISLSAGGTVTHRASPLTGEHTDEVLGELGYQDDEIADLRARSVI
jgi:crotonobetainyl-CoA:carnitine CoA-transferase CaiB-like acyl-CoA transferase